MGVREEAFQAGVRESLVYGFGVLDAKGVRPLFGVAPHPTPPDP